MGTYLQDHPPRQTQFRARRARVRGVIVVHSAESAPDLAGGDGGAEAVAEFIRGRSDYGSYHDLCDSDSAVDLVPYELAAFGDGTGSNEWALHLSAATQAHRWPDLPEQWVDGCLRQMAKRAARMARWIEATAGITVPARRITRAQSEAGVPGFISHGDRDPGRRSDPGPAFPWDRFLAYYAAEMEEDDMATPEVLAQLKTIEGYAEAAATAAQRTFAEQRAIRKGTTRYRNEERAKVRQALASLRKRATQDQADEILADLAVLESAVAADEAEPGDA
ncbi:hypothetical protein GCM10009737_08440 [Nocardioides lentus]|uniref:N-acetylmuramoyl-L-alanine amidase domain-containing protein n=1 Tax=Nocardioides lentus TaxID=338077 RepID=A0ABN2P235_9ACTN